MLLKFLLPRLGAWSYAACASKTTASAHEERVMDLQLPGQLWALLAGLRRSARHAKTSSITSYHIS